MPVGRSQRPAWSQPAPDPRFRGINHLGPASAAAAPGEATSGCDRPNEAYALELGGRMRGNVPWQLAALDHRREVVPSVSEAEDPQTRPLEPLGVGREAGAELRVQTATAELGLALGVRALVDDVRLEGGEQRAADVPALCQRPGRYEPEVIC